MTKHLSILAVPLNLNRFEMTLEKIKMLETINSKTFTVCLGLALGATAGCNSGDLSEENSATISSLDDSLGEIFYECTEEDCNNGEIRLYTVKNGTKHTYQFLPNVSGYFSKNGETLSFVRGNGSTINVGSSSGSTVSEICSGAYKSACDLIFTAKHPGEGESGAPVYAIYFELFDEPEGGGLRRSLTANLDLVKYIIPSPNQQGAGTCHYMANTGAMEILLNKYKENTSPKINGDTDLSEKYLVRTANLSVHHFTLVNSFNGSGILNSEFPFINSRSEPHGNARDNWGLKVPADLKKIDLPKVKTKWLAGKNFLSNKDEDMWKVPVWHETDIVDKVKGELDAGRPVVVNYNHNGYWHVVVIAGYDDEKETACSWLSGKNFASGYTADVRAAYKGCSGKGVFYVRDSLGYAGKGNRAARYGTRSYEWLKYLGNKAFSVDLDLTEAEE